MNNNNINLFNIICVGPLLIYIGINQRTTHEYYYNILGLVALTIPYIMSQSNQDDTMYKSQWLVLFSFFLYVALCKNLTHVFIYNILVYFGLYIIFLHSYYLYYNLSNQRILN